ncbi:MAG: hypothetical protein J6N76_07915 [Lachnospiraceae bacterium]|nr:hypothetical protein [Lachnospiraceae bacterium]
MKNVMHFFVMGFIFLILAAAIMGVTGRNLREKEQTESLSQAMSDTIRNLSETGVYSIGDKEEFKADFIESLADKLKLSGVKAIRNELGQVSFGDRNLLLQVDFIEADAENELLMVHVKERFSYLFGIEGVAENTAAVIFSEEESVKLHIIEYKMSYAESVLFNCAPNYKKYEQEENENIKTPASPIYYEAYDPDNQDSSADDMDYRWICTASSNEDDIKIGDSFTPEELGKKTVRGDYTFAYRVSHEDRKVIAWMNGKKQFINVPYGADVLPYLNSLEPSRYGPLGYSFIGWSETMSDRGWSNSDRYAPEHSAISEGEITAQRSNRNYYAMYAKDNALRISYDSGNGTAAAVEVIDFRDVVVSGNQYSGGGSLEHYYYTYNGLYSADCPRIWSASRYGKMRYKVAGAVTRDYYRFDKWICGNAGFSGRSICELKDFADSSLSLGFKAEWKPLTYKITVKDPGKNAVSTRIYSYTVESEPFYIYAPDKKHYTFKGWSGSGVSGKGALYIVPGSNIQTAGSYGIKNAHGNITINAGFSPVLYYVNIDGRVTHYTVESESFYISPSFIGSDGVWKIGATAWQEDEWGPAAWGFWGPYHNDKIPIIPGTGAVYAYNCSYKGYNVIGNAHGNYVLYTY